MKFTCVSFSPLCFTVLFSFFFLFGCNQSASDATEAVSMLTAIDKWSIDRITVNDDTVLKDGKPVPSFDGITIDRYMSTITFEEDGLLVGDYNKGTAKTELKWKMVDDQVIISAMDSTVQAGEWMIDQSAIRPDAFVMYTSTQAYDFPNTTTVSLYYKK
ncbi:hypothetical protein CLV98_103138 [Dyadobacter jejuensis]|uniref:Lipocalin-like protein n=1 Tax=Dyadobacter jejuensis TaxID=1082580 RepID=A0A316AMI5_9BACT|nr:hypothetical protein [Dyadobacter jejuensis]PWJ58771.1 hypothetical protein CLV98_103138 [Dyadobacter jejuensis]